MSLEKLTEDEKLDLIHFWQEKGDLERYIRFEELKPKIQEEFPEILKAWSDYKATVNILNALVTSDYLFRE